jgi:hypothetical protein
MLWIQSSLESRSPFTKAFAISAIMAGRFLLQIGSGIAWVAGVCAALWVPVLLATWLGRYLPGKESIVFPLGLVAMITVFISFRLKTRQRRLRREAARWLADRSKMSSHPKYFWWQRRAKRWSMWAPFAMALLILLFLPETSGVASHVLNSGAGTLGRFQIQIPLTGVIVAHWFSKEEGFSYVEVWAMKGLARDWRFVPKVSVMSFTTQDAALSQRGDTQPIPVKTTSTRTFSAGLSTITCWEEVVDPRWGHDIGFVRCFSSPREFEASFAGQRADIPGFYGVLQSLRQTER